MIKCKNGGCPKNKDICCKECDELISCETPCGEEDPSICEDAVFEGSTELEVFQSKALKTVQAIVAFTVQKKHIEEQEKILRENLEKVMDECGVKFFENDVIKITHIPESVRNSVDSAKLKKKYPDIAAECNKTSNVKAFVKIEVK